MMLRYGLLVIRYEYLILSTLDANHDVRYEYIRQLDPPGVLD